MNRPMNRQSAGQMIPAIALAAGLVLAAAAAHAGDRHDRHGFFDRRGVTARDFYLGNIERFRVPGNGNYFYIEGRAGSDVAMVSRPAARIIDPATESACVYESGVCVIRLPR